MLFLFSSVISLIYICFIYALLISQKSNNYKSYNKPFSVIIPVYNENKKELKECLSSVIKAKGEKEIIVIDNNSDKIETLQTFLYIKIK